MPPRGVKKGSKRARQYEHVKDSLLEEGKSEDTAEEIAARTVDKERARHGEAKEPSRLSREDISSGRRGGLRSHRRGPRGRTKAQLYEEARRKGVEGRSKMTKAELARALGGPSLTDEAAQALLGLPVCADGVRLGTVGAVWVDAADAVLGMEFTSAWNGTRHYLPFAAARLADRTVRTSSIAILGTGPITFFEQHGARRVAARTEAVGLGPARPG